MVRITLKGYYGFANLGDDLLLLVCSKWIKEIFPDSTLIVSTASSSNNYIKKLTDNIIDEVVPLDPEPKTDLVIHGGGGTYFDFDAGNSLYLFINKTINRVGINKFRFLLRIFRLIKGWPMNQGVTRIALGIGIGRFTDSSTKYYQKAAELAGFHLIVTRDEYSYHYLLNKKLKATILNATDLVFLREYWLSKDDPSVESKGKNLGFILRKWESEPSYLQLVHQAAEYLALKGYCISVFIFEQSHDQSIQETFNQFNMHVWEPEFMSLSDYIGHLKKQDVLITSRAHGAIIASALGIPPVCIGIEPKLKWFHDMLPNSSVYVELPISVSKLFESIKQGLTISRGAVDDDFNYNRHRIVSCLKTVKRRIKEKMI